MEGIAVKGNRKWHVMVVVGGGVACRVTKLGGGEGQAQGYLSLL